MLKADFSSAFDRDVKRCRKRGLDMSLLKTVITVLLSEDTLDAKYKDHPLYGNWKGCRELHILPDWLLIYRYCSGAVYFARTGTHSDLLEK